MEIISFQKRKLKKCSIEGCSNFSRAKGLCNGHYAQFFRHGEIQSKKLNHRFKSYLVCKVKNCGFQHYAKGYCLWHYNFFRRDKHWSKCLVKDCDKHVIKNKYCKEHLFRVRNSYPLDLKIDCRSIRMKGSKNPNFAGGFFEYPNHYLMKKNRLIILLNNPRCGNCGKPATEIHHKDFSKTNHDLSNLMAVCHKCNTRLSSKFYRKYGLIIKEIAERLHIDSLTVYKLDKKDRLKNLLI